MVAEASRSAGTRARSMPYSGVWSRATFGDVRSPGRGLMEMRVDYGSGYRIYFVRGGELVVILLCGGDKRTQTKDIERARNMAEKF